MAIPSAFGFDNDDSAKLDDYRACPECGARGQCEIDCGFQDEQRIDVDCPKGED